MAGIIGTRCLVCSEKFNEKDDIVVCPHCGTPYHRECYVKSGDCVNTALHESGRTWQPTYDVGENSAIYEDVKCEACGRINSPMTLFCENCGVPLSTLEMHNDNFRERFKTSNVSDDPAQFNRNEYQSINMSPYMINFSDKLCGYNPDEDYDGVKLSELGDYVDTNTHYYLPVFKLLKETGRNLSWNLTAILFPELYFAHRKMPLIALGAYLLHLFFMLPNVIEMFNIVGTAGTGGILVNFAMQFDIKSTAYQAFSTLVYVISYASMFLIGMYSNYIYYKKSVKKIKKIKVDMADNYNAEIVSRKGGTSIGWMALFLILDIVTYMILFVINSKLMLA